MIRKALLFTMALVFTQFVSAQTIEELKTQKGEKDAAIAALQAESDALKTKIDEFPGWKIGGVGTVGFNINTNNNWFALGNPNSASNGIGLGFVGYANNDQPKYFWRNGLNINLNRLSTKSDKDNDATRSVALSDLLDFSSLYGYKLSDNLAISAEVKWLSSLVEFEANGDGVIDDKYPLSLNNPGQLVASAGITWTPITDLVVLIHPLGYQKNWPGEFISSPGAKIGATYTKEIVPGVKWNSSLSAFIPYTSGADVNHVDADDVALRTVSYGGGDLVNWVWNNGFSFTVWKGIGVGVNLGLRGDQQIADKGRLISAADPATADLSDNPLQSFFNLGLSYGF